jgi:hypothetical protein
VNRLAARPKAAALSASVLLLSGCASYYRPALKAPEQPPAVAQEAAMTRVGAAFAAVRKHADQYTDMLNDQLQISPITATFLAILGGAGSALAITGAGTAPLVALAATGATGYGIAAWYRNPGRMEVFAKAPQLYDCLLSTMAPLNLGPRQEFTFRAYLRGLDTLTPGEKEYVGVARLRPIGDALDDVNAAIVTVEQEAVSLPDSPSKTYALQLVQAARELVRQAEVVQRNAVRVDLALSQAPETIYNTASGITGEINQALKNTEPDFNSLATFVKDKITPLTKQFLDVSGLKAPAAQAAEKGAQVRQKAKSSGRGVAPGSLDQLADAMSQLDHAVQTLAPIVERADQNVAPSRCIDAARASLAVKPFTVSTPDKTDLAPGEFVTVTLSGGNPDYSATPVGAEAQAALEISQTPSGGQALVTIHARTAAKAGTYAVNFGDKSGASRALTFRVAEGKSAPLVAVGTKTLEAKAGAKTELVLSGGTGPYKSLGATDDKSKKALTITPAGELPADKPLVTVTLTADAKASESPYHLKVSDAASHELAIDIAVTAASQASAPAPVDARRLQEALKGQGYDPGPLDGVMGPLTEAALKKYQTDHGLTPSGRPDSGTMKQLGLTG